MRSSAYVNENPNESDALKITYRAIGKQYLGSLSDFWVVRKRCPWGEGSWSASILCWAFKRCRNWNGKARSYRLIGLALLSGSVTNLLCQEKQSGQHTKEGCSKANRSSFGLTFRALMPTWLPHKVNYQPWAYSFQKINCYWSVLLSWSVGQAS